MRQMYTKQGFIHYQLVALLIGIGCSIYVRGLPIQGDDVQVMPANVQAQITLGVILFNQLVMNVIYYFSKLLFNQTK